MNATHSPMPTTLTGPAGALEILAEGFDTSFNAIAIICHPHPLHGGTLLNKVVHYLARSCRELGLASLRFNYRGVGKSDGRYGEGIGESEDLLAIIDWLAERYPGTPLWLAGFSFGSYVALRAAGQRHAEQLITIAPAVNRLDFSELPMPGCPWLLIHGDADEVVPFEQVVQWVTALAEPPETVYMEGVGHFFHGQLPRLQEKLMEKLAMAAARLSSDFSSNSKNH